MSVRASSSWTDWPSASARYVLSASRSRARAWDSRSFRGSGTASTGPSAARLLRRAGLFFAPTPMPSSPVPGSTDA
ncbi:hypothetical protein GM708_08265 [Vibrio cholerae]|nr:hypothetical protein [Vibrio cholerae]